MQIFLETFQNGSGKIFYCPLVCNRKKYLNSIPKPEFVWGHDQCLSEIIMFANQWYPFCYALPQDVYGQRGHLLHVKLQQTSTGLSVLRCVDFSGSNITDPSWNTYEISKCIPTLSLHFQACYFKRGNTGLGISLFKRKRYLSHFFECDCEEIALLVEIPV